MKKSIFTILSITILILGLATIDHAGPFAGIGSVHTSPI